MRQPHSLNEQRLAHCRGEILRGCGIWPTGWGEGEPEPPFEPFRWSDITRWDLCLSGFDAPYQGLFGDKLKRLFRPVRLPSANLYYCGNCQRQGPLCVTTVSHYAKDEVAYPKAEQLLLALGSAHDTIAFELFSIGKSSHSNASLPRIEVRFAASKIDVPLLESQLHSHYPRSAVVTYNFEEENADQEWKDRLCGGLDREDPLYVAPLYLAEPYCFPIRTFSKFGPDPLAPVVALMDELKRNEWALVQVLFCRAKHPWTENIRMACEDPYQTGSFMVPGLDRRLLEEKLHAPLYAATIHLAANSNRLLSGLGALVHQYQSAHNRLALRDAAAWASQWNDNYFPDAFLWRQAIHSREALVPGMLFNAVELAGIVHLPSPEIPSERLQRVLSQTRQPPKPVQTTSTVVIGENVHRGQVCQVAIPHEIRCRHTYIAGASGTGKTTLLLNMIIQDIAAGHGVGLLDPHGDLLKTVLRRIPEKRIKDVVLFDAADKEFPFALNILEAHDEAERERIVAETIMSLERYFPSSWGPRLERILQYTIRTALNAIPDATLADVERMLTDNTYRADVVAKTTDTQLCHFWTDQFRFLPKNACDPVLNKLSVFLLDRQVRNIICQRRSAIDFDRLLSDGKILLVNLSTGLLTEKVAGTLGSFLVTKIVNAAFRRAALPESKRRPWFLYIDEFHSFMNLSVGFERILAEARKYKLVLAGLANQYVGQLSPAVRQAIFGNVGTFIVFRLGTEDAQAVAKEMGVFTADDILNLELGQAIARVGGSATAFNLQTFKEPPLPPADSTRRVIALARQCYARPRHVVEAELAEVTKAAEKLEMVSDSGDEPSDPSEDDLVR